MANFWLAQANIARMRAPLTDPVMEGFVKELDHINSVADQSPGFVWRLQTEEGDATSIRAFEDPMILFNMSVWESLTALHRYVYASEHVAPLRSRRQWFEETKGPTLVLWWVGEGYFPTVSEAKARFELLNEKGPTREAFTFRKPFSAPGQEVTERPEVDAEFCGGII